MQARAPASGLFLSFVLGCASAPGTQPHDMSAAQHEAAAKSESREADQHKAQYTPEASLYVDNCPANRGCWTTLRNPTQQYNTDAAQHRNVATQHRQASKALIDAEQTACAGVPEDDRDMSPFRHRDDITSVTKLERTELHGKVKQPHLAGAMVMFRAVPGLTEQWLQRVLDCHLARNAAMGHDMKGMEYCPLMPKGARASVRATADGFAVDVTADNKPAAEEILKRAQALGVPMAAQP